MKNPIEKFCAVADRLKPLVWAIAAVVAVAGVVWVVQKDWGTPSHAKKN